MEAENEIFLATDVEIPMMQFLFHLPLSNAAQTIVLLITSTNAKQFRNGLGKSARHQQTGPETPPIVPRRRSKMTILNIILSRSL